MVEFALGVLASLMVAGVVAIIPAVRTRFFPFWLIWHQSKAFADLYKAGVLAIQLERKRTNPIDLISSTNNDFVYIGVVPNADDLSNWCRECFERLLSSGKSVTLVFWGTNVGDQLLSDVAQYYMMSTEHMRKQLQNAWSIVTDYKNSLPEHCSKNLDLRWHNRILTDSVFLIDTGVANNESQGKGRIHLDQKLFGLGKSHATGALPVC